MKTLILLTSVAWFFSKASAQNIRLDDSTGIYKKRTFYVKWDKDYKKLDTIYYRTGIATTGYYYGCKDKMMEVILDTAALLKEGWLMPTKKNKK
jgi:hypothetical protein